MKDLEWTSGTFEGKTKSNSYIRRSGLLDLKKCFDFSFSLCELLQKQISILSEIGIGLLIKYFGSNITIWVGKQFWMW